MGTQSTPVSGDRRPILGSFLVQLGCQSLTQKSKIKGQGTTQAFRDSPPAKRTDGEAWLLRPKFCLGVKKPSRDGRGKPGEGVKHQFIQHSVGPGMVAEEEEGREREEDNQVEQEVGGHTTEKLESRKPHPPISRLQKGRCGRLSSKEKQT